MKALFGATGPPSIILFKDDLKENRLETKITNYGKEKDLTLFILDENLIKEYFSCDEKGFHIHCYPHRNSMEERTKIFVYVSKNNINKMVEKIKNGKLVGFTGTRCRYDRLHFHYYSFNPDRK